MPMNPRARARLVLNPKDQTLGTIMERLAEVHGDRRIATEHPDDTERTYVEAADQVAAWAGAVAARVEPGARVVLALPNTYDLMLACLAASRAGAIPVPVNDRMRPEEVEHVIQDSGADLVVRDLATLEGADPMEEAKPTDPADSAALFYTSGTTGKPKGADLTHRGLVGGMTAGAAWPAFLRSDEAVVSLPVAHIMGFAALLGLSCAGIPVYFLSKFRPNDVLDALESRKSSIFIGVPAMYRMMWEAGAADRDLSSVRAWISGADAMPPNLANDFKKLGAIARLPGLGTVGDALFVEGYGMVETGGGAAAKISAPLLDRVVGEQLFPLPGYEFKVVDEKGDEVAPGGEGELLLKGPGVLKGYWGSPEATADAVTMPCSHHWRTCAAVVSAPSSYSPRSLGRPA
ncbi:MAG TPA: AMP-binding protein, partial [Acidimicrobiales bacterium]|nr:AMP-binding protein [Acidimicrobiales bacterium]